MEKNFFRGRIYLRFKFYFRVASGWLIHSPYAAFSQKKIAIVGDPSFGGELTQLTGARREAVKVGQMYHVKPLLGIEASETNLSKDIGSGADTIHFATHGFFDPADPLSSAIFLTNNNKPEPITARKIFENPLAAKLVILSACETGMGKSAAGEDMLGLTK